MIAFENVARNGAKGRTDGKDEKIQNKTKKQRVRKKSSTNKIMCSENGSKRIK